MASREEIEKIVKEILEANIDLYISRYAAGREEEYNRLAILQRLIRLEEELKAQRQLFEARFAEIDKRFEDMNKRFEDMNKRFEDMNKRFEDMNSRFNQLTWVVSTGFVVLALLITVFKFLG